jgi:hypothetical protein
MACRGWAAFQFHGHPREILMKHLIRTLSALCLLFSTAALAQEGEVDIALVLAVDVSNSMDREEQELQRQGFVEAFRSSLVHDAVRDGMLGRIAVAYVEWAGEVEQKLVVPWTVIEGAETANRFADRLQSAPISRARRTSISGAIDFGVRLLGESNVEALRQVIDISGDGANNRGRLVTEARDEAVAKGITVNGLPIMLKKPRSYWDIEDLDLYYRDCVIGGQGAFMVPVRERHQFAEAIKTKIVREIAGPAEGPLIQPAQAEPRVNCLAAQSPRLDQWRN